MATMKVTYQPTVNGPAFSGDGTTIVFMYGTGPHLLWNGQLVTIDHPSRFGTWGNSMQQRAFVRAFVRSGHGGSDSAARPRGAGGRWMFS